MSALSETATRPSAGAVLGKVARDRASRIVFALTAIVAFVVYGNVLPVEEAGGRLAPANLALLSGTLLVFSIALSLTFAAVLALQMYAMRQAIPARRAASGRGVLGGAGFLVSLVPHLCCTPVLPAVLAVFGVGASGAAATMEAIAPVQLYVLTAVLVLFFSMGSWTLRRLTAQTSTGSCCP